MKAVTQTEKRNRIGSNKRRREHISEFHQSFLKVDHSRVWRIILLSNPYPHAEFSPSGMDSKEAMVYSSGGRYHICHVKGRHHQPSRETNQSVCVCVCACMHVWDSSWSPNSAHKSLLSKVKAKPGGMPLSLIKYLLSTYYVPGLVMGSGNMDEIFLFHWYELTIRQLIT